MRWLVALALVGCASTEDQSPWPDKPVPDRVPDDPRLGVRIEGLASLQSIAITGARAYAFGQRTGDVIERPYEIDASGLVPVVRELAEPPFSLFGPLRGVTANDVGITTQSGFFDGTAWTAFPADPEPDSTNTVVARSATELILGREYDNDAQTVGRYWNGSDWHTLVTPGTQSSALGPWDASGLRVVWSDDAGHICTAVMNLSTFVLGTTICSSFTGVFQLESAFNGSIDNFVVQTYDRLVHFENGVFSVGDSFAHDHASLERTASSPPILRIGGDALGSGLYVDASDAAIGEPLLPAFPYEVSCTCDRSIDAECPCVPRMVQPELAPWPARDAFLMISGDYVDGRGGIYIRLLDVPSETPWFAYP